jgi:hypothetical protein
MKDTDLIDARLARRCLDAREHRVYVAPEIVERPLSRGPKWVSVSD